MTTEAVGVGLAAQLFLLFAVCGDELGLNVARDLLVLGEFHGEFSLTLGRGAEVVRVAEHFGEGNFGDDGGRTVVRVSRNDDAAALVQAADDVALELFRGFGFDAHDGLEDDRLGFLVGRAECTASTNTECHVAGVNGVRLAVVDAGADAGDGEADEATFLEAVLEAAVTRSVEFTRDGTTDDFVHEFVFTFEGLEVPSEACVLTGTTGLTTVGVVELGALRDAFAVGNLGCADFYFYAVFATDTLDVYFEVELAHTTDDGLAGLIVTGHAEGGVFTSEAAERFGEVLEAFFFLRLD